MKIAELKRGMSNVSVEGKVIDKSETRNVMTRFGMREVATALIEDDSGRINLTLWGKQINEIEIGNKVRISGAFVTEFREELQLNVPKSGKIKVLE